MLRKNHRTTAHRTSLFRSLFVLAAGAALLAPIAARAADTSSPAMVPSATSARKTVGLKTAIVAATDTSGDADLALRALKATNIAVARSSGYVVMPASQVASGLQKAGLRWPFAPREYEHVRGSLNKADRVVAVWVTPADVSDASATVKAIVEMYDTTNGGLVGRGEATYTALAGSQALVSSPVGMAAPSSSAPIMGSFPVPAGTATTATAPAMTTPNAAPVDTTAPVLLASDGAILRAVAQMNEPAQLNGIVVSLPQGHFARLSEGTMQGLRNGARIEYLVRGTPIAYGTVVDVGQGESLATVAPERAFPYVILNSEWRTAEIPPVGAAGLTRDQIDNREWKKFETNFGVGLAVVGLGYLIYLDTH